MFNIQTVQSVVNYVNLQVFCRSVPRQHVLLQNRHKTCNGDVVLGGELQLLVSLFNNVQIISKLLVNFCVFCGVL